MQEDGTTWKARWEEDPMQENCMAGTRKFPLALQEPRSRPLHLSIVRERRGTVGIMDH